MTQVLTDAGFSSTRSAAETDSTWSSKPSRDPLALRPVLPRAGPACDAELVDLRRSPVGEPEWAPAPYSAFRAMPERTERRDRTTVLRHEGGTSACAVATGTGIQCAYERSVNEMPRIAGAGEVQYLPFESLLSLKGVI